jgi:nucleotide-binding universal stress UspA family protein
MILGNSNSHENIYGNTAKQLAHGAHCPLIFVPQNYFFNGISRIVYGCTEKGLNKKTIRSICNFSGFFGSALDFVHVGSEEETEGLKVHIEELLNAIDVKPRIGNFYFTDNRSVVKALMDYTNNFKPDILVMEHDHSRNGLEHLILGSVTTKAVESLFNIPLLILYHS